MVNKENFKELPSVNSLVDSLNVNSLDIPRPFALQIIREELASLRKELANRMISREEIKKRVEEKFQILRTRGGIRKVINGTGVVLHTNLGRAPISKKILSRLVDLLSGYSNLEFDLEEGERGDRLKPLVPLINALTNSNSSLVVNNNAAAVLLAINTVAEGKDVLVSRGQLVEIGGSFRIPSVVEKSGAILKEVGTTNRTHLRDYQNAITKNTGAILVVHTSNYRVTGFTKDVEISELSVLSKKKKIPLVVDLGSGALFPLSLIQLPSEPVVSDTIKKGADIVTFSGDKLLGGPQAGIICGKERIIKKMKSNPLYRAMRCDKITLTLLYEILLTYRLATPMGWNQTYAFFQTKQSKLLQRARAIIRKVKTQSKDVLKPEIVSTVVEAGSGSLPLATIPSAAICLKTSSVSQHHLSVHFRKFKIPIIGYMKNRLFYIDLKAVFPEEDKWIASAIDWVTEQVRSER